MTSEESYLGISILFAVGVLAMVLRNAFRRPDYDDDEPNVLEVLPMTIHACHECSAELWLGGSHSDGCRNRPVHHDKGGWWFWDETWSDRCGPYPSQLSTIEAMDQYCVDVLGIQPEDRT